METLRDPRLLTFLGIPRALPAALNRIGFRAPLGPFTFKPRLPGRDPIPAGLSAAMIRHKEKEHDLANMPDAYTRRTNTRCTLLGDGPEQRAKNKSVSSTRAKRTPSTSPIKQRKRDPRP